MSTEIRVSDNWLVKSDPHCWVLVREYETKKKGGGTGVGRQESYHANLGQVARYIAGKEAGKAETVEHMAEIVARAAERIEKALGALEAK